MPRRRAWVAPVVLLVLVALASVAIVVVIRSSDDGATETGTGASRTPSTAPTTTEPVVTTTTSRFDGSDGGVRQYCDNRGDAWADVPPYVAGQPARTWVQVTDPGVDTALEPYEVAIGYERPTKELGGSTVLSPVTDGAFIDDLSVMERTRTVTCVDLTGTTDLGQTCEYGTLDPSTTLQLAQNHYAITVYELHSGGILHKGEFVSRAGGCPRFAYTDDPSGKVAWGITDDDLLGWMNTHFQGGQPA